MTVSAYIESAGLASFGDSSHIETPTGAIYYTAKDILLPSAWHHGMRVSEKLNIYQRGCHCNSKADEASSPQPFKRRV